MTSKSKPSAKLTKLLGMRDDPIAQRDFAIGLLKTERSTQIVEAALKILQEDPEPTARPILLELFQYYASDGVRRDAGGHLRVPILKILRDMVQHQDIPLLEQALFGYEFLPPSFKHDSAELIRAHALIALNELDEELASFHSVRLLTDPNTSEMSGEPAITAVRILAGQGNLLPLYGYVMQGGLSEVVSESMAQLERLPASLLPKVVEKYGDTENELILVGLFDLLIKHKAGTDFTEFITEFLTTTRQYEVFRYLTTAIIASRKSELTKGLLEVARREENRRKTEILLEVLNISPRSTTENKTFIKELEAKLAQGNR